MEEIIASISRVIAEDKHSGNTLTGNLRPGGKVAPGQPEGSDILELTQVVDKDGSIRRIASRAAAEVASSSEPVLADPSPPAVSTTHADPQGHAKSEPTLDPVRERIVSTATSGAAAAAFAQLGTLPRDRRREGEMPLGGAERTLEEIVRGMLRPMLQSWLDEHLPDIVERLVREEIARVVGESGLR
jgi:cell pole-organizing protein PopZ